jgi:hypothetical protein
MLVTFASQGPPCEVLDRVEVDETDTQVTITLYQGRDPDIDADQPCDGPTTLPVSTCPSHGTTARRRTRWPASPPRPAKAPSSTADT